MSSNPPTELIETAAPLRPDDPYPILKCRVTPLEFEAFRLEAKKNSEKIGTHLKKLIQAYLLCDSPTMPKLGAEPVYWGTAEKTAEPVLPGDADPERLEFRLPRFLKEAVRKRAEAEGMKSAQWVAALVQSSLMKTPVLNDTEIEVVSWANRELAAVGRNLNQIARSMNRAELIGENFKKDEQLTLEGIREVDAKIKKLRAMVLRLVAARHRAWGVENDPAS
jgi:hypothetical protein